MIIPALTCSQKAPIPASLPCLLEAGGRKKPTPPLREAPPRRGFILRNLLKSSLGRVRSFKRLQKSPLGRGIKGVGAPRCDAGLVMGL